MITVNPEIIEKKLNLIYSSDEEPGFTRKKHGKGFRFFDEQKKQLDCEKTLRRIQEMVIPPIWKQVWICRKDNGHLQSTGRDPKNRKQYIYHPEWTAHRQAEKFSKMIDFVAALPKLRKVTEKHLRQKKWNRTKVLALAVKILDQYYIRIGNKQYAKKNGTYGLTTLRRKHVELENGDLKFSYKAKSNKYRNVQIDNPRLIKLIKACSELPGYELLRYRDEKGSMQSIESSDVNEYVNDIMGGPFTSKDFRTWAGTSLAVKYYYDAQKVIEENVKKKLEPTLVKMVAKSLGNTMSVCRKYYIHPQILDLVRKEKLNWNVDRKDQKWLEGYEVETKRLLKKYCK